MAKFLLCLAVLYLFVASSKFSVAIAAEELIEEVHTATWQIPFEGGKLSIIGDLDTGKDSLEWSWIYNDGNRWSGKFTPYYINERGKKETDNFTATLKMTFPRFHRHLPKWENVEIGGQHEHEDPTIVYGDV